jgi:hypothetical protein
MRPERIGFHGISRMPVDEWSNKATISGILLPIWIAEVIDQKTL